MRNDVTHSGSRSSDRRTRPFPQQTGDFREHGFLGHQLRFGTWVGGRCHQPPQVLTGQRKRPEHAVTVKPHRDRVPRQGQIRVDIDE